MTNALGLPSVYAGAIRVMRFRLTSTFICHATWLITFAMFLATFAFAPKQVSAQAVPQNNTGFALNRFDIAEISLPPMKSSNLSTNHESESRRLAKGETAAGKS